MMPVKNGVDALREFRSRGDATPVVVITSKTEAALSDMFDGLQTAGHLVKPLTPTGLVQVVKDIIEN